MDRANHYEAAFEAYLQWHRLGYVAIDETRRTVLDDATVKSLDFMLFGPEGARLVVDVKGRRYPGGRGRRLRRVWECWATFDDIDGLERWAGRMGAGYQALLVFSYHLLPFVQVPDHVEDLWVFRGRRYLIRAVPVDEYRR